MGLGLLERMIAGLLDLGCPSRHGCKKKVWSGTWYDGEYFDSSKDILFWSNCILTGLLKVMQTRHTCPHKWVAHFRIRVCSKCHKWEEVDG